MSLLFPAYLLGLFGLALPWILHRFSDQNPPVQLFPSRQFLEPTTPPVSRKRTLRYRALLALRLLAVLLLCLLFAQPWINSNRLPVAQQLHHMIVVDQSLSMRSDERWASAQAQAEELISRHGDGSAQLIGFDTDVRVLASNTATEEGLETSLTAALQTLQPGYGPADYGLLMQRLDRLASEQTLPAKVWLISDMQQSALPAQLNALYAPNVSALEFVPVETAEAVNVHLAATAETVNDATATVTVTLLASADAIAVPTEPVTRTVVIEMAGSVVQQRSVDLIVGELAVLDFDELVLPAQANPEIIVSLAEADALAEDNTVRLPVTQALPTGVVLLRTASQPTSSSSVFVTTALETDGMASVESIAGTILQIPRDTSNLVTGRDLSREPLAQDILQFVDRGNNALVFNTASNDSGTNAPLEGLGAGSINEAHPLALGDINWFGTEFYELPEFELMDGDRVLLRTSDGQNVLVERPVNRGRLLILNDPLDGLASNLPFQPSFVALMHTLIRYFDASTSVPAQVVIGERLALPANVQLIDASGTALLALADSAQASTIALDTPGLYTVVSARGEQTLRAVLDADEADISRVSEQALAAWQARYTDTASATVATADDTVITDTLQSSISNENSRQQLWQWLLPLTALLFFAEGWFANRRLDVRRDGS